MDAKLNPPVLFAAPPAAGDVSATVRRAASALIARGRLAWKGWLSSCSRATQDELRGMSDRDLADLGIGRGEIPHLLGLTGDAPVVARRRPMA